MAFKSSLVSYLCGLMSHLALRKMVEGASAAGAAAMSVGEAGSWVYPAALLGAPLVGLAEEYFNNRNNPEELAGLYRESLLHAIETCVRHNDDLTDEERRVVKLWEEGLKAPVKGDPLWHAHPGRESTHADAQCRPATPSKRWPLLRAQLERWTNWFD
jgi:hypothetical protein